MTETLIDARSRGYAQADASRGVRRILLITTTFPPHTKVGAIRAERLARTFSAAGHEVTVLTVGLPDEAVFECGSDSGAREVAALDVGDRLASRVALLMERMRPAARRAGVQKAATSSGSALPVRERGVIRRFTIGLLSMPDSESHFIRPAVNAMRRREKGAFDIVYSTAPPFSAHVAATRIASALDARLILEFRDPWNHPHARRGVREFALTRWLDDRLERRCVKAADSIVTVSAGAAELIRQNPSAPDIHVILNGVPSELLDSPPIRREGPLRIIYAGSLYLGRDPRKFLDALALAVQRNGWSPDDLRLEFLGECRRFRNHSIEDYVRQLGLAAHTTFVDRVPHAEAARRIATADITLLLAQQQPIQIPNKLYDYLAMRTPIIAYADTDGETARMLHEVGGHLVLDGADQERDAGLIERLLLDRISDRQSPVGDLAVLDRWRADRQMQQLLEALEL